MAEDGDPKLQRTSRDARRVSHLVHWVWMVGLLLPVSVGLAADLYFQSRGIEETSLMGGLAVLVATPITIMPFLILSLIIKRVLGRLVSKDRERFEFWLLVSVGAVIGLSLATVAVLIEPVQAGAGDPFGMMLALWPITVPLQIVIGAIGSAAGGLATAATIILYKSVFN